MANNRFPASPRVLHITPWREPCGIAGYAESLVRGLEQRGIQSSVLANNARQWRYFVGRDSKHFFDAVARAATDHDVVHIQHEWSFFTGSSSCASIRNYGRLLEVLRRRGIASCTTFHTEPVFVPPQMLGSHKQLTLKRWLAKRFSPQSYAWNRWVVPHFKKGDVPCRAVVHTPNTRAVFARSGLPTDSITTLPMGFEQLPHVVGGDRIAAKQSLGLPDDIRLVSIFGFVSNYKGHDVALDALKQLPKRYHLAVVGGAHPQAQDGFFSHVVARAKRFAGRVHVTGYADRTTADTYMTASDACLAPYHQWSGLASSAAITRSIASGRPVIASKIEAFSNLQKEADCLLMVAPGQKAELAWAIERVCDDPLLQHTLGQRGVSFAAECSWANVAEQTIDLYTDVLDEATQGKARSSTRRDAAAAAEPAYAFRSGAGSHESDVLPLRRVA